MHPVISIVVIILSVTYVLVHKGTKNEIASRMRMLSLVLCLTRIYFIYSERCALSPDVRIHAGAWSERDQFSHGDLACSLSGSIIDHRYDHTNLRPCIIRCKITTNDTCLRRARGSGTKACCDE